MGFQRRRRRFIRSGMFGFNPAALFAQGQQGVWLEASPTYKGQQVLWQDDAGTTAVTADNDPVGRDDDLSPNGHNASQSTTASKPLYRTDGTLHWLEFDGVDDFLSAGNVESFNAIDELSISVALSTPTDTNQHAVLSKWNGGLGFRSFLLDFVGGGFRILWASEVKSIPVTLDGSKHVYTVTVSGGLVNIWEDGIKKLDNASLSNATTQTNSEPLVLGCKTDIGDASGFFPGDIYGIITQPSLVSDEVRTKSESYLADLAGITL